MPVISTAKLIAIAVAGVLFLVMAGTIWWLFDENGTLHETVAKRTEERDQAVQVNKDNLAELATIRLDAQRATAALAAELAETQARAARTLTIKQEIARVAPTADRPVGPVLHGVLDLLRVGRADGDQDRAGQAADRAGAAVVRPGTAAPGR